MAAAGTVAANCNLTGAGGLHTTGFNPTCLSNYTNVTDMVGNVSEWVANYWDTLSASTVDLIGQNGIKRGGDAGDAANVFFAITGPLNAGEALGGFRCAL